MCHSPLMVTYLLGKIFICLHAIQAKLSVHTNAQHYQKYVGKRSTAQKAILM